MCNYLYGIVVKYNEAINEVAMGYGDRVFHICIQGYIEGSQ